MISLRSLTVAIALATCLSAQAAFYVDGASGANLAGHGSTSSQPWRTISFALQQIGAPVGPVTLFVQGDFSYAPGTNGETFPLLPPPRVTIEGIAGPTGQQPCLKPPPGAGGIMLDPTASYTGGPPLLRNVTIQGGEYGLTFGPGAGSSHIILVENCHFDQNALHCIRVTNGSGYAQITMDSTTCSNTSVGIAPIPATPPSIAHLSIDLAGCSFDNMLVAVDAIASNSIQLKLHECSFQNCGTGIQSHADDCSILMHQCTFTDCNSGASLDSQWVGMPIYALDISRSTFIRCSQGIRIRTLGNVDAYMSHSTFSQCATGIEDIGPYQAHDLHLEDCTFLDNATGLHIWFDKQAQICSLVRCRFLRGSVAVHVDGYDYGGTFNLNVSNCLFAQQSSTCLYVKPAFASPPFGVHCVQVNYTTFADSTLALDLNTLNPMSRALHSVFNGNTTDIGSPTAFLCIGCLTDNATLSGSSNTVSTDASLLRPSYKLWRGSPCIDAGGSSIPPTTDYEGDPRPSPSVVGGPALVDIGADEFVATGSLQSYGITATGPSASRPRIHSTDTTASIGGTFRVELSGASTQGAAAVLAIGATEPSPPQPFDLTGIGIGGTLWVTPEIFSTPIAVNATGSAVYVQHVPDLDFLVSLPLHYQWLVASLDGWTTSDGLRVTLGW